MIRARSTNKEEFQNINDTVGITRQNCRFAIPWACKSKRSKKLANLFADPSIHAHTAQRNILRFRDDDVARAVFCKFANLKSLRTRNLQIFPVKNLHFYKFAFLQKP
jgi:hypothetical protein